ncbi:MAG: PKD domain-containing protein, partial [Deltaproteobacteria bacterium]|nr:PKD domain-containing protein [Deltaproteobacteria bacterium]
MQAKTSFFVALFFILFLQTVAASQALAAVQADAGPDQTVNEGDTVTLDGSNSSHRKLIIGYFWQQTGGSPSVTLKNANKAKASFTAPQVGPAGASLTFQLTVTYNFYGNINILTDTAIVNVRFVNDPPTADAGPDQNVDEETTVTLDGSDSFDPDDGIESYRWKQIAGPSVSLSDLEAVQPTFLAPNVSEDGTSLTFELTVTDVGGLKATDTTTVNVTGDNDPPTADAGPDQNVDEETTVTLDGSNSSDPDDGIKSYRWKQVAGPSVTLSNPQAAKPTFLAPNVSEDGTSLTFELTVTDTGSLKATDTTTVNVTGDNDPPVADAGPDQNVDEETTVTLDGSNSFDPDDVIESYRWKQVAGPS